MKKLTIILIIFTLTSCSLSDYVPYRYSKQQKIDKSIEKSIKNQYQNYYWEGENNGIKCKLIIEEIIKESTNKNLYKAVFYIKKDTFFTNIHEETYGEFQVEIINQDDKKIKPSGLIISNENLDTLHLYCDTTIYYTYNLQIKLVKKENDCFKPFSQNYIVPYKDSSIIKWNDLFREITLLYLQNEAKIFTVKSGKVIKITDENENRQLILIKHLNGKYSLYKSIFSEIKVQEGELVNKGQLIGIIGGNDKKIYPIHFSYSNRINTK